jgi:hypothetical protein
MLTITGNDGGKPRHMSVKTGGNRLKRELDASQTQV